MSSLSNGQNNSKSLSKTLSNPLAEKGKKADLGQTISSFSSSKTPDINQITMKMDNFENRIIKRKRVQK